MIGSENFQDFTYAKWRHFEQFRNLDLDLYGESKDPRCSDLKVYQDLLVLAFIKGNLQPGSRLLEVGGGDSRVIKHLAADYECWNLDALEGNGNGPREISVRGFRLVQDYIGANNPQLPDDYFDLVYSISVIEHLPKDSPSVYTGILVDINRVLKPGGWSLHCVDVVTKDQWLWIHPALHYMFKNQKTINELGDPRAIINDPDLYIMSESAFKLYWQRLVGKAYQDFGRPSSCNILWRKLPT